MAACLLPYRIQVPGSWSVYLRTSRATGSSSASISVILDAWEISDDEVFLLDMAAILSPATISVSHKTISVSATGTWSPRDAGIAPHAPLPPFPFPLELQT